jgi:indole-3-glycerol phosphate synthase
MNPTSTAVPQTTRLEEYVEASRRQLARRRLNGPSSAELERAALAAGPTRSFTDALARAGTSLIAEHKRCSPSIGRISQGRSVADVVRDYERGGAAAISIITEEERWEGSLDDLYEARAATNLPILRKDFTVDREQLYEARIGGADAVLLVVGSLSVPEFALLIEIARDLDLDALVEVRDEEELAIALDLDVDVIGINNRHLSDLSVDLRRTPDLMPKIPPGKVVVSESGIQVRSDIEELEAIGVDAVLVGSRLMQSDDPEKEALSLVGDEARLRS